MNDVFIVTAVTVGILAVIVWAFFAVILENWTERFVALIITIIFWLFIVFGTTASYSTEQKNWNNGYCTECGGEYKFSGASENRRDKDCYYTCEECDHTIITNTIKR